jgi:hypothetical protein
MALQDGRFHLEAKTPAISTRITCIKLPIGRRKSSSGGRNRQNLLIWSGVRNKHVTNCGEPNMTNITMNVVVNEAYFAMGLNTLIFIQKKTFTVSKDKSTEYCHESTIL